MSNLNSVVVSNSSSGYILSVSSSGSLSWSNGINNVISVNNDIIEFTELLFTVLGYDITFEEFSNMTKEERKSIIRDIKINRVLEDDK